MRKSRATETQIVKILKEVEAGRHVKEDSREYDIYVDSTSEFYPNTLCNYTFISKKSFLNTKIINLIKIRYKDDYKLLNSEIVMN